jgi:hypothetical protein
MTAPSGSLLPSQLPLILGLYYPQNIPRVCVGNIVQEMGDYGAIAQTMGEYGIVAQASGNYGTTIQEFTD